MALKDILLSSLPQYTEILATEKKVNFRPLIVSEEKAILIAKNSGNKETLLNTLINVLQACYGEKDLKKQTICDFENMFLLLRAKSIGEIETFEIVCPETGEHVHLTVNLLEDIKLNNTTAPKNNLKLGDNLLVVLKPPTVKQLLSYPDYANSSETLYGFIGDCIKQVQTLNDTIDCTELSTKEKTEFIQSLTSNQFKKIIEYFDLLPSIEVHGKYKTSDGKERCLKIKGIFNHINFFFEHLSLQLYYQQNFEMKYNHKYSLEEIETMIPWERTVYLEQIRAELKETQQKLTNSTNL
jgi:hypothetical protein